MCETFIMHDVQTLQNLPGDVSRAILGDNTLVADIRM
jgi:hypothetical protein